MKNEIIRGYTGDFEIIGKLSVGDQLRETDNRFRNNTDCEASINAIDENYDAEDSFFTGYTYKLNTPQFNLVKRSQYGNGCDFRSQIFEYCGKNCYLASNGYCFIRCENILTNSD